MIIQGGMGVAISSWKLAKIVSQKGQMGVVSGTGLSAVLMRTLQMGDLEGHARRALDAFPVPHIARRIMDKYFIEGGKGADQPYKRVSMHTLKKDQELEDITVLGSFVDVFLAKEGHNGVVGINLLEKIQLPTLPVLYGALLAGVDYVLMGAGIPMEIPGALDKLAENEVAILNIDVDGSGKEDNFTYSFDPRTIVGDSFRKLKRPNFLAIISSAVLAMALVKRAKGEVNGFIVEGPLAGGHNAPPRGKLQLTDTGEPIYGEKDVVDLDKILAYERPVWLAGSEGSAEGLRDALRRGATGIQVGTAFAYCEDSGFTPEIRRQALDKVLAEEMSVYTDPLASPTGFPFKVAQLEGSMSEQSKYEERNRICDLGYLRKPYKKEDGNVGYRCKSEPVEQFLKKGGDEESTKGRKCLCNALLAACGHPQVQKKGYLELPLVTAGDGLVHLKSFMKDGATSYTAEDVLEELQKGAE